MVIVLSLYSAAAVLLVCMWSLLCTCVQAESHKWDAGFCINYPCNTAAKPVVVLDICGTGLIPQYPYLFINIMQILIRYLEATWYILSAACAMADFRNYIT